MYPGRDMDKGGNISGARAPKFVRPKGSLINRFGRRIRHPLSRFFAQQSTIETTPVIAAEQFAQLSPLLQKFSEMRREALDLLQEREAIPPLGEMSPDHRRIASDERWKSFFLHGYGYDAADNQKRCPVTSQALAGMPGLVTAFVSIMEPGTYVPPHRGLTTAWVNCHLPLVLPKGEGRCEIAIDGQLHQWREGEWLVFDDTYTHEVWNETSEPRVVLLIQLRRPMRFAGRTVASVIFHLLRHSNFVQDVRRKLTGNPS